MLLGEGGVSIIFCMTENEKKKYIIKQWKFSSGPRIKEMLKRYWNLKNPPKNNIIQEAELIFHE